MSSTESSSPGERAMRSADTASAVTVAATAASDSMMQTAMSSWPVSSAIPLARMPAASTSETAMTLV